MTSYLKKKPHIYAYRRRKTSTLCVQKLNKIVQESSNKDVQRLMKSINNLLWAMEEKLGWFDNIPKGGERWETPLEKKVRMGEMNFVNIIASYICPKCGRPGYLFSPNLDLKGKKFDRHMLHITWPEKKTEFCQISKVKTHLILISNSPAEGILTMKNYPP
jgi:hypothetical protein